MCSMKQHKRLIDNFFQEEISGLMFSDVLEIIIFFNK
jgi:hypothetical protein